MQKNMVMMIPKPELAKTMDEGEEEGEEHEEGVKEYLL